MIAALLATRLAVMPEQAADAQPAALLGPGLSAIIRAIR